MDDGNIAEHARPASCCLARPEELSIRAAHGREIQGMALQSYLFFGSANRLYPHVKELLFEHPGSLIRPVPAFVAVEVARPDGAATV